MFLQKSKTCRSWISDVLDGRTFHIKQYQIHPHTGGEQNTIATTNSTLWHCSYSNCLSGFFQSPALPPAWPASWIACLISLWCRGLARPGQSSTLPRWCRKMASRRAAGLTASSVGCPTFSVGRTTRWRSSPRTRSVTLSPVRPTRCCQVSHPERLHTVLPKARF